MRCLPTAIFFLCFAMASWLVRARARQSDSIAYSQVYLTPCLRLFRANIAGSDSDRRAGRLQATYQPILWSSKTRFVYVTWTATSHLSSGRLFLNWAGVHSHIAASDSEACFAAGIGFEAIHVDARAGNVMEGAWGASGPAQEVCQQPPGKTIIKYCNYCHNHNHAAGIVVKAARWYTHDCDIIWVRVCTQIM